LLYERPYLRKFSAFIGFEAFCPYCILEGLTIIAISAHQEKYLLVWLDAWSRIFLTMGFLSEAGRGTWLTVYREINWKGLNIDMNNHLQKYCLSWFLLLIVYKIWREKASFLIIDFIPALFYMLLRFNISVNHWKYSCFFDYYLALRRWYLKIAKENHKRYPSCQHSCGLELLYKVSFLCLREHQAKLSSVLISQKK
jgi:hypothetical protein